MGLDADIRHGMKQDIGSGQNALPGLGGGPLLFPEDPNTRPYQVPYPAFVYFNVPD
jgi:hypothetical protein